jgi:hypothetical protein
MRRWPVVVVLGLVLSAGLAFGLLRGRGTTPLAEREELRRRAELRFHQALPRHWRACLLQQ